MPKCETIFFFLQVGIQTMIFSIQNTVFSNKRLLNDVRASTYVSDVVLVLKSKRPRSGAHQFLAIFKNNYFILVIDNYQNVKIQKCTGKA